MDMLTLQTIEGAVGSEVEKSTIVLKPASNTISYSDASGVSTEMVFSDDSITVSSRNKSIAENKAVQSVSKCHRIDGNGDSVAATLMKQKPAEFSISFGGPDGPNGNFKVDNTTKKIESDMSCIEFGSTSDATVPKHRLKIFNGKLYIQKKNASGDWVGAEAVLDAVSSMTATISLSALTTPGAANGSTPLRVTGTVAGTDPDGNTWDKWMCQLDDTHTSPKKDSGGIHSFTDVYPGEHTIAVWAVDASDVQISEKSIKTITVTGTDAVDHNFLA
jgi:hypothetical protein